MNSIGCTLRSPRACGSGRFIAVGVFPDDSDRLVKLPISSLCRLSLVPCHDEIAHVPEPWIAEELLRLEAADDLGDAADVIEIGVSEDEGVDAGDAQVLEQGCGEVDARVGAPIDDQASAVGKDDDLALAHTWTKQVDLELACFRAG